MALPFLRSESEENATQAMAFIGIGIVTVGLMIMNVTGALAGSQGTETLQLIVRGALAVILSGAELLAAVALVRVMLAPNWWRKVVGTVIFLGLAWACIQNGKRAVHLIFPEFEQSAALLAAQAEIAGTEASQQAAARQRAIDATPVQLERVQGEIAALQREQLLMASQSPEKIAEAQGMLIAQGKYFAEVDGIRGPETERAMRARGEEIRIALESLRLQESNLADGITQVVAGASAATVATNPAVQKAELEDRARKARAATIWVEVMLWVFEGARSFGLWALVTTITAKSADDNEDHPDADSPSGDPGTASDFGDPQVPQAGTSSDPHRREYWQETVEEMLDWRQSKQPRVAFTRLVEKFGAGRTAPEFSAGLRHAVREGWVTQEAHDRLMQVPAVMNGADTAEDNFTPPQEGADNGDTTLPAV